MKTLSFTLISLFIFALTACGSGEGFDTEETGSFNILGFNLQKNGTDESQAIDIYNGDNFIMHWLTNTKESHTIDIELSESNSSNVASEELTTLSCGTSLHNGCSGNSGSVECSYQNAAITCSAENNATWSVDVTQGTSYLIKLTSCEGLTDNCITSQIQLNLPTDEESEI